MSNYDKEISVILKEVEKYPHAAYAQMNIFLILEQYFHLDFLNRAFKIYSDNGGVSFGFKIDDPNFEEKLQKSLHGSQLTIEEVYETSLSLQGIVEYAYKYRGFEYNPIPEDFEKMHQKFIDSKNKLIIEYLNIKQERYQRYIHINYLEDYMNYYNDIYDLSEIKKYTNQDLENLIKETYKGEGEFDIFISQVANIDIPLDYFLTTKI